jgi:hypothetical protein
MAQIVEHLPTKPWVQTSAPQKKKFGYTELTYDPAILLLGIFLKEIKVKTCEKTTQCVSTDRHKQNIVHPYNGILLDHKKEWNIDAHSNIDEIWKRCSEWKIPDTKVI